MCLPHAPSGVTATASPASIEEAASRTVSGAFADAGTLDTHAVVIDLADNSALTTLTLDADAKDDDDGYKPKPDSKVLSPWAQAAANSAIDDLVQTDRLFATIAIQESVAKAKDVASAQGAFTRAVAEEAANHPDHAIDRYREA